MAAVHAWDFGILGPLSVTSREGEDVDVRGRKQRALLIALVLRRGQTVTTDRLVEDLWGDSPPPGAAKTLQIYVSRLRASLGDGLIARAGAGYVLTIDPERVDAVRFEQLVDEGAAALAADDPQRASAALVAALALWRGAALADVEYEPWARAERERLEELRLLAQEEHVEARLRSGESDRLVSELRSLVTAHPLRERLRAQAMLALYRSGRQAEALQLYQEGRQLLVGELGLEPGPELQELQRRILAHDPALGGSGRRRWQLPSRRGRAMAAAGALVVVGAGTLAALAVTRGGSPAIGAEALARVDARSGSPRGELVLPSPATSLATGGGAVWALSGDAGTVTEMNATTGRLVATFAAGVRAADLAFGGGRLWILASGAAAPGGQAAATVDEVDPGSRAIEGTIRLPPDEPGTPAGYGHLPGAHLLVWAAGALWASAPGGAVYRIDAARGRVAARVGGVSAQGLAAAGDSIWARLNRPGPMTFEQIDPRTDHGGRTVQTPAIGLNAPASFAVGDGVLWVPDTYTGLLYRVTPGVPPVVRAASVGVGVTTVVVAGASVFAGDDVHDTLTQVDAGTPRIDRVIQVASPQALASTSGAVFVASGPAAGATLPASACGPLVHGGTERPRFLIASDLALQGPNGGADRAMARAVEWTLRRHGFRAGGYTVGYQSCDDSTRQAGGFDFARCVADAQLFAKTPSLLGVVGTANSPCTGEELPLLNQAPTGAVPIVSPQDTYQILTLGSPVAPPDVLRHFYPTGVRNFLRVTPTDTHEMAADALLARELGLHRVLVVADDGTGGSAIHTPEFERSATGLGLRTRVFLWHAEQQPARVVVAAARRFAADGIFISAGLPTADRRARRRPAVGPGGGRSHHRHRLLRGRRGHLADRRRTARCRRLRERHRRAERPAPARRPALPSSVRRGDAIVRCGVRQRGDGRAPRRDRAL